MVEVGGERLTYKGSCKCPSYLRGSSALLLTAFFRLTVEISPWNRAVERSDPARFVPFVKF